MEPAAARGKGDAGGADGRCRGKARTRCARPGCSTSCTLFKVTTDDEMLASLRRENIALQARVAQLETIAAKYHALCTITPDVLLVIDREGRYLEIAPTRGAPPEVIAQRLGTTVRDTFPAELAEQMLACVRHTLATGEPSRLEYLVPYPEGFQLHAAELTPLSDRAVLWFAQDVTAARQLVRTEQTLRNFEAIVESTPDSVALIKLEGALVYTNAAFCGLLAVARARLETTCLQDHVDGQSAADDALAHARTHGAWHGCLTLRSAAGTQLPCQVSILRLHHVQDDPQAARLAVIARDLTPMIESERERVAMQEQIIAAQRTALRELSTPLLPLASGVVAMPLIGTLDAARAREVMETLLEGITRQRAHTAILDVTGVRTLDRDAADALVQVASAGRLLGARVILTGISPDIAQTLVTLEGGMLRGITMRATLQTGIAEALAHAVRARAS